MKKVLLIATCCGLTACRHSRDLPAERTQILPESMLVPLIEEALRYSGVQNACPGAFRTFINDKKTESAFERVVPSLNGWKPAEKREKAAFTLRIDTNSSNGLYIRIVLEEADYWMKYARDSRGFYKESSRYVILE